MTTRTETSVLRGQMPKSLSEKTLPGAMRRVQSARRRPMAAREAYFLYVERAAEGANAADGPFSSLQALRKLIQPLDLDLGSETEGFHRRLPPVAPADPI